MASPITVRPTGGTLPPTPCCMLECVQLTSAMGWTCSNEDRVDGDSPCEAVKSEGCTQNWLPMNSQTARQGVQSTSALD
eukprot:27912-Eustigmatos_ZCMA.PRE.1